MTKAVFGLHNFLIRNNSSNACRYCSRIYVDQGNATGITAGEWRITENNNLWLEPLGKIGSNNYSKNASLVRQEFKEYFNSEGTVERQWQIVNRTATPHDRYFDRLEVNNV